MTQENVVVVDFKLPRDAYGVIKTYPSVAERAKEIEKDAYDKALADIVARAEKLNW